MADQTTAAEILKDMIQGAEENRATARDMSIPAEDRRDAAQAADAAWRGIMHVARRLAHICEQESRALGEEAMNQDPDDFSRAAIALDARGRVWDQLDRDMDALALRAAGNQNTERMLDAEIADI